MNTDIIKFAKKLKDADAILIGAGSGMSAASGFRHYYERDEMFAQWFSDFEEKYGFHSSFDGFYYPYKTAEERWAYIARLVCCILDAPTGNTYQDIQTLLAGKPFHILTTNQDTQFSRIFSENQISAVQGDWRYLQCSAPCHDKIYRAEKFLRECNASIDQELKIPGEKIPHCPQCGKQMEPWVRGFRFLEGVVYQSEHWKVQAFIQKHKNQKLLLLELGVGRMTPMFIQEPFWQLTRQLPNAFYITVNPNDALVPEDIKSRSLSLPMDIGEVLRSAVEVIGHV